jgi:hypothetical protein
MSKGMLTALVALAVGATFQGSKDQLKAALKDEVKGNWIYDDAPAGFAEAKKSGKPLLLVFR